MFFTKYQNDHQFLCFVILLFCVRHHCDYSSPFFLAFELSWIISDQRVVGLGLL